MTAANLGPADRVRNPRAVAPVTQPAARSFLLQRVKSVWRFFQTRFLYWFASVALWDHGGG